MIKAISYWSLPGGGNHSCPVADAAKIVAKAGFAGIELAMSHEGAFTWRDDEATCKRHRDAIADSGIACETLASGMGWWINPNHPDPVVRKRCVEVQSAMAQRAAWVGAKSMLFVPGTLCVPEGHPQPWLKYEESVEHAHNAIVEIARVAERVGVELCIENVGNGMFYSPLEFRQFIDDIGSPAVGVYFDVANHLPYSQHPADWIRILGKRIKRVHVKDYRKSVGTEAGFCDLLAGDVPWPQTMQALHDIGYDGTLVAEVNYDPGSLARTSVAMDIIMKM